MAVPKISAGQQRRIDEVRGYLKSVEQVRRWVADLEQNRAAKASIINGFCSSMVRELSHMRQRALSSSVGTLADTAGALSIIAGRTGGGLQMKIRALNDGVNSLSMMLDQALKSAMQAEPADPGKPQS
jgi:hypothetical protein